MESLAEKNSEIATGPSAATRRRRGFALAPRRKPAKRRKPPAAPVRRRSRVSAVSPEAKHQDRPETELRLITLADYPTAREAGMIWEKVSAMPYFLDDAIRNPYIFEQIIGSSDTVAFMIGRPAPGIMWAF